MCHLAQVKALGAAAAKDLAIFWHSIPESGNKVTCYFPKRPIKEIEKIELISVSNRLSLTFQFSKEKCGNTGRFWHSHANDSTKCEGTDRGIIGGNRK